MFGRRGDGRRDRVRIDGMRDLKLEEVDVDGEVLGSILVICIGI